MFYMEYAKLMVKLDELKKEPEKNQEEIAELEKQLAFAEIDDCANGSCS